MNINTIRQVVKKNVEQQPRATRPWLGRTKRATGMWLGRTFHANHPRPTRTRLLIFFPFFCLNYFLFYYYLIYVVVNYFNLYFILLF